MHSTQWGLTGGDGKRAVWHPLSAVCGEMLVVTKETGDGWRDLLPSQLLLLWDVSSRVALLQLLWAAPRAGDTILALCRDTLHPLLGMDLNCCHLDVKGTSDPGGGLGGEPCTGGNFLASCRCLEVGSGIGGNTAPSPLKRLNYLFTCRLDVFAMPYLLLES